MIYHTMPIVDSCCCGCTLKTGTIIIIFFNLVLAYDFNILTYYQDNGLILRVIGLIFSVLWICAQVIGLYGILISGNKNFLLPLMTLMAIFTIMIGVDIVWVFFISEHPLLTPYLLRSDHIVDTPNQVWRIIHCVCYIVLFSCDLYFLLVVYSFFQVSSTSSIVST